MKANRILLAFKAFRELGPRQMGLYGLYLLGLRSGVFRRQTPQAGAALQAGTFFDLQPICKLPDPAVVQAVIGQEGLVRLKEAADEIAAGRVRLFGGESVPLCLTPPGELAHWTAYARGQTAFPDDKEERPSCYPHLDIKYIWEPARFGWAFTLARAYHLTGDERYPEAFWRYFETFQQANPVNTGPNWASAQETALRLIAFVFADQCLAESAHTTAHRAARLAQSVADHAARIPPTLIYARAQNNNHLLSEAAGLITAAMALPDHTDASRWSKLGWRWFRHGLAAQIAEDGAYMQHSTNYHRLMLQLVLWVAAIAGEDFDRPRHFDKLSGRTSTGAVGGTSAAELAEMAGTRVQASVEWLFALCDQETGRVPNLGPNDGAYILPLTVQPFHDYRPVLQAAAATFLDRAVFAPGPWDEMGLWLGNGQPAEAALGPGPGKPGTTPCAHNAVPGVTTLQTPHSWAYLRTAKFTDRPGHADQLHLDLWWRGLNVALDPGTYLYNANPPWANSLTHTACHNTVTVNGQEQMTRAGRFLYVDWAQAGDISRQDAANGTWTKLTATHDGYRGLGVRHQRTVTADQNDRWLIDDRLMPFIDMHSQSTFTARVHWLLPDWPYVFNNQDDDLQAANLRIKSPFGWVRISVSVDKPNFCVQIIRAGELIYGEGAISPSWGWTSPTYGQKTPALSFAVQFNGQLPLKLRTEWSFPNG